MDLTEHFSMSELTHSDTAERFGIDNNPTVEIAENLTWLAENLEKVRELLALPMRISSGYRCKELNAQIGGASNSAHMSGLAADFTCPEFGTPNTICHYLLRNSDRLQWDQLIQEGSWVHIAFPKEGEQARVQVLTANFSGGKASYSQGI